MVSPPVYYFVVCSKHGDVRWKVEGDWVGPVLVPCCNKPLNEGSLERCFTDILTAEPFLQEGAVADQVTITWP